MNMQDTMTNLSAMANDNLERLTTLGEINMRLSERMVNRQLDLISRGIEQGAQFVRTASEARGYGDLYKAQLDLAKDAGEHLMAESKANLSLASEARDDYRAWFQGALEGLRQQGSVKAGADA